MVRGPRGGPKSGYVGNHVYSLCSGPDLNTKTEKHCCIGNVIAKDEATVKRLAVLVEAAPLLLAEVIRLREILSERGGGTL